MTDLTQSRKKPLHLALAAVFVLLGAVWLPAAPVNADSTFTTCNSFYDAGGDTPCPADDGLFGYCIDPGMPDVWADRAWWAAYWVGYVSDVTSVSETCNWGTDVAFHLAGYSGIPSDDPSVLGRYQCHVKASATVCDHAYAIGNPGSPYIYQAPYGSKPYFTYQQMLWNIENMFCHEVGHSMSLRHDTGYGGCMVSGYSETFNGYSTHHVGHLNALY